MSIAKKKAARVSRSEEGAAMLIIMLMLLMVTGTAVFAIHATGFEMRAAGYNRQATQTRYVGETGARAAMAWVDHYGPPCVIPEAIRRTRAMSAFRGLKMAPFEPELSPNKDAYRIGQRDFSGLTGAPVAGSSLGRRLAYEPIYAIDVYDHFVLSRASEELAGYDVSTDRGVVNFMNITYTSRGRTRNIASIPDFTSRVAGDRPAHEGSSDARAYTITGPFDTCDG